ncbi:MAG TPA: hypothetical protein VHP11_05645 [Tepidisphaeraceae bacterium]|nr:hypothetical protein [Tepidisphaeraceae bacterium]
MKKMLILGIAAGLLAFACAAHAYPTLSGPTGEAVLPTAAVVPAGEFNVAADFYNSETPDSSVPVRVLYGISNNFEIGAGYTFVSDANTWGVNAKYATPLNLAGFGVGIGARYASSDMPFDLTFNTTDVYAAGTKCFPLGEGTTLSGTVGLDWTFIDFADDNTSVLRPYLAAEVTLSNKLTLAAEYQFENDNVDVDGGVYAISARYPIADNLGAQVGFTNVTPFTNASLDNGNFFIGANYVFGTAAEK